MRGSLATLLALACLVGAGPLQGVSAQQYAPPSESECRPYIERALKEHGTPDTPPASIEDTGSSEETAGPEITLNEQTDPEVSTAETTPESEEGSSAENVGEVTSQETEEVILERERRSLDETDNTQEGDSVESVEQGDAQSVEEPTAENAESSESAGDSSEQEEATATENAESESPEENSTETTEDLTASMEATEEAQASETGDAESVEEVAPMDAESLEQDPASLEAPEDSESSETEATPTEGAESVESQETASTEGTESLEGGEVEETEPVEGTEEGASQEQQSDESAEQATGEAEDVTEEEGTTSEAETGEASLEEPAGEESSEEGTEEAPAAESETEEGSGETGEVLSRERRSLDEEVAAATEGDASSEEQTQEQPSSEEGVEGEGDGVAEESSMEVLDSDAPAAESEESSKEGGQTADDSTEPSADEASTEQAAEESVEGAELAGGEESAEGEEPSAEPEAQEASAESQETGAGEPETEQQVTEELGDASSAEAEAEEGSPEEPAEAEAAPAEMDEEEREVMPEEELSFDVDIPDNLRPRDHIAQILKLDESSVEDELLVNRVEEATLKDLKRFYDNAIKPLEILYKYRDLSNRHFGDPEIFSKPLILFMGPWSGGKSTIINYLLDNEYTRNSLRTGAEPSPAYFNLLSWGEREEVLDGTQLAADWTFSGLQKFGQGLLDRLRGLKLNNRLLEKVNIVEIPGILEIRKQVERLFPFNDACQWFIDRADIIFLVYDPSKLDVGPETEAILDQLKGREYQTRIILNKADQVRPEELMRVQGTLIWNISPLMSSSQPPVMYSTSLWSMPYEDGAPLRLLRAQERAFLRDMREAIDKRVENKIASARRFAVRVRNHAKMVDCYLTTYYNHKSFFGNRKRISDDIIERPQDYHIYAGLSTLTNISRYDLPDPETYRDFFQLNPLYDFQQLAATCTYFKGCPINRLDVAIAYDLPELVGKYKKAAEAALEKQDPTKS